MQQLRIDKRKQHTEEESQKADKKNRQTWNHRNDTLYHHHHHPIYNIQQTPIIHITV